MKAFLKLTTAAAALAGAAVFGAPAGAAWVGVGVGPIGFDIYSGGYCDRWGCPREYWNYPIFYGPVYYDSTWYRGPVYYRAVDGERWYWIHGAWHRDQWRGARPTWAREYHYGPPRGLDYYREHGFRVRDEDWRAWHDRDYRYRTEYRDRNDYRYGDRYRDQDRYRDYDRERYPDYDRDRAMDRERSMDRDYNRERGTYEHSGYDRDQDRARYDRDRHERPDYDRDRAHGTYEHSRYDRDHNRYEGSDHDQNRSEQDHMRPDDQSRDHGNSGASGGSSSSGGRSRSGSENSYERTRYEPAPSHGHAKPPPVTSHSSTHKAKNPDEENNGPSD